jgi:hypothetical protein
LSGGATAVGDRGGGHDRRWAAARWCGEAAGRPEEEGAEAAQRRQRWRQRDRCEEEAEVGAAGRNWSRDSLFARPVAG